jgi:hypothetical protein
LGVKHAYPSVPLSLASPKSSHFEWLRLAVRLCRRGIRDCARACTGPVWRYGDRGRRRCRRHRVCSGAKEDRRFSRAGKRHNSLARYERGGTIPPDVARLAAKLESGPPLKGVALQCANLLKLATNLKTAVSQTTKDELSVPVVRDAGEIADMAHKMRDQDAR